MRQPIGIIFFAICNAVIFGIFRLLNHSLLIAGGHLVGKNFLTLSTIFDMTVAVLFIVTAIGAMFGKNWGRIGLLLALIVKTLWATLTYKDTSNLFMEYTRCYWLLVNMIYFLQPSTDRFFRTFKAIDHPHYYVYQTCLQIYQCHDKLRECREQGWDVHFHGDLFWMAKKISGRDSCRRVFLGKLTPREGGTVVEGEFGVRPLIKALLFWGLGVAAFTGLYAFFHLCLYGDQGNFHAPLLLTFSLLLFIAGLLLYCWKRQDDKEAVIQCLQDSLSLRRES